MSRNKQSRKYLSGRSYKQGRREGGGGQNTWGPDWFGGPEILIKHLVIALLSRGLGDRNG